MNDQTNINEALDTAIDNSYKFLLTVIQLMEDNRFEDAIVLTNKIFIEHVRLGSVQTIEMLNDTGLIQHDKNAKNITGLNGTHVLAELYARHTAKLLQEVKDTKNK